MCIFFVTLQRQSIKSTMNLKTKLFSFFLALAASVGTIIADGTKIGDLYYNLDADNLTAEVTYQENGTMSNYSNLTSANILSSVTYNDKTFSVTSIGEWAFQYCIAQTFPQRRGSHPPWWQDLHRSRARGEVDIFL